MSRRKWLKRVKDLSNLSFHVSFGFTQLDSFITFEISQAHPRPFLQISLRFSSYPQLSLLSKQISFIFPKCPYAEKHGRK